jgi:periplasmic protein TonB
MKPSFVNRRVKKLLVSLVVAAVATISLAGTPAFADEIRDWRIKVAKKIAKKHIYPRSAISREIEGKARVKVTLARDGVITNFEIIQPTGQKILDKAIPKMMKKLTPLPSPPDSMPDAKLTFVIPITWRLQ